MVRSEVYRSNYGSFEANSITTGTQKGRHKIPTINGTSHFVSSSSLKSLANHLITYLRIMQDAERWKQFEDILEITFPRNIKIFHHMNGNSRILYPLSESEVGELWEHINYYSKRKEVRYED